MAHWYGGCCRFFVGCRWIGVSRGGAGLMSNWLNVCGPKAWGIRLHQYLEEIDTLQCRCSPLVGRCGMIQYGLYHMQLSLAMLHANAAAQSTQI